MNVDLTTGAIHLPEIDLVLLPDMSLESYKAPGREFDFTTTNFSQAKLNLPDGLVLKLSFDLYGLRTIEFHRKNLMEKADAQAFLGELGVGEQQHSWGKSLVSYGREETHLPSIKYNGH